MQNWSSVVPGVWLFRDSCNVYAVEGRHGMLIVDAGTGAWLSHLDELPYPPQALICTHYFRDHSAGAAAASRQGIAVFVPQGERESYEDPAEIFRRRETYLKYDNLWDLFIPIEPIALAGTLVDYGRATLCGLNLEVVPLPGATVHQIGLATILPGDAKCIMFCGEAIHSHGRLARIAPLQYDYQDLGGAVNAFYSAHTLLEQGCDVLCPSLGEPMMGGRIEDALLALKTNLRSICASRTSFVENLPERLDALENRTLRRVSQSVWYSDASASNTTYLISRSGKALAIDYGYEARSLCFPHYASPANRRALLHDLAELKSQLGVDRIDAVLVSHFHDDHVSAIPILQRLFGTQCWATDSFADLLSRPEAHRFPCNAPEPIRIDRRIGLAEKVRWEEFEFEFAPMSGHTRFSALIGFLADGLYYAHTGDQYLFFSGEKPFAERKRFQNHVYANGALHDGYKQSSDWLLARRPDIVLNGHEPPYITDDAFFAQVEAWTSEYQVLHQAIMPLDDDQPHFDFDSWAGWILPYRTLLSEPGLVSVTVTVRNPLAHAATLKLRLVGPAGWRGTEMVLRAGPREEINCDLGIFVPSTGRRQAFVLELEADGQRFGQVAEALVTVGEKFF